MTVNQQHLSKVIMPVLRRVMPNVIANSIIGVQPMTGPTATIFAMSGRYSDLIKTIIYYDNHEYIFIKNEEYDTNGMITKNELHNITLHSTERPCRIEYLLGREYQVWYYNGKIFRQNGLPSRERYIIENNKRILDHANWTNEKGQDHRIDGPAMIRYSHHDYDPKYHWCLDGMSYIFNDWIKLNSYINDEEKVALILQYS